MMRKNKYSYFFEGHGLRHFFVIVVLMLALFTDLVYGQKEATVTPQDAPSCNSFDRRYLAIDQALHYELHNMQMVMGQACNKRIIFKRFDNAWEETYNIDGYEYICGVIRDHKGGLRMYYRVTLPAIASHRVRRREAMAVAFSDDGVNWAKPALNIAPALVDHPSSNLINIEPHPGMKDGYYYRAGTVFFDRHAPRESRYKLLWRVENNIYVAISSDGLNFVTQGKAISHKADTQHSAFYDPLKGEYVIYGRKRGDWEKGPADRRGLPRHSSKNWADSPWTNVGEIVVDPMDVWDYNKQVRPQVYAPAIQVYHGQYIGLPSIFFVDSERQPVSRPERRTGTFYPLVMHSQNGTKWTFPDLSHPIIELEPHERISSYEYASFKGKEVGMVCTAANFLEAGDRLLIYYTDREGTHYEAQPLDNKTINVAFMRMDGFASIQTQTGEQGEWITPGLKVPSGAGGLKVNADVAGTLRVEVLDAQTGMPIDGLGLTNSVAFTGDDTSFIMVWEDGTFEDTAGQVVQLHFVIDNGAIYSFSFQPHI